MTAKVNMWVIIDNTNGTPTAGGEVLTNATLTSICAVVQDQLNGEYADEYGGESCIRAGSSPTDVQPGEKVGSIVGALPDAPGASAYHNVAQGVPDAFFAIATVQTLVGEGSSLSVDISHEMLEAEGDPGCDQFIDDGNGTEHADERCDAVEVQTYPKTAPDGSTVYVSNFLLDAWGIVGAEGPYSYMAFASLPGAVDPPGPLQTAPGDGGNYQIIRKVDENGAGQVTANTKFGEMFPNYVHHGLAIEGTPRKGVPEWNSRASRIFKKAREAVAAKAAEEQKKTVPSKVTPVKQPASTPSC